MARLQLVSTAARLQLVSTAARLQTVRSAFRIPAGSKHFSLTQILVTRSAGPFCVPLDKYRSFVPEVKRSGREVNSSFPASGNIEKECVSHVHRHEVYSENLNFNGFMNQIYIAGLPIFG